MKIRVVFSGRGYDSGQALPDTMDLPDGSGVEEVIQAVNALLPSDRPLPSSCLVTVSGVHLGTVAQHAPQALREGDEVVLVAPVAGGA